MDFFSVTPFLKLRDPLTKSAKKYSLERRRRFAKKAGQKCGPPPLRLMSIIRMKMLRKMDILFVSLCLLGTYVRALNYPYPVFPSKYLTSATSPAANKTEAGPAKSPGKPIPPGTPFTIFYQQAFPQSRGGKNLNVTLVSEAPQEQARIMNQPNLYPVFLPTFGKPPAPINPSPPQQKYSKGRLPDPKSVRYTPPVDQPPNPSPPLQKYVRGGLPDPKIVRYTPPTEQQAIPAPPPLQKYVRVGVPDSKNIRYAPPTDQSSDRSPPLQKYARGPPPPDSKNVRYVPPTDQPSNPPPPHQKYYRGPPVPDFKNIRYVPPTDQQANPPPPPQPQYGKGTPPDSKSVRFDPARYAPPTDRPDNSVGDYASKTKSPEAVKKQTKAVGYPYSVPQQVSKSIYIVSAGDYGDPNYRFRVRAPEQTTPDSWPCFCVPYYLCKNGVINSGGRSVAALSRKARSYNLTNEPSSQPKVMSGSYVLERESDDPSLCGSNKVCCRLSFSDGYYPVATPPPARIPGPQCGARRAYGIQTRITPLQYPKDVAEFGEYPWQVAVLRRVEGQKSLYLCGGVLISPSWVATAAHCIKKEQSSPLLIRLGEWDVNRKDEVYPFVETDVDSLVLHPEFDPDTLNNDLALLRMKTPADERLPHVTPVCLPQPGTVYDAGNCWVSGWGKDFFGPQGEYQNILKEVDVPVLSKEACDAALASTDLGPDFSLHPGFLCAGGEAGKDACTGDGGSPLVCASGETWYVVGLVSWGIGCGQPGIPGIYVNMLYYNDWISSIINR